LPYSFTNKHSLTLVLGILVCFYLINGISYLQYQTITSDEASFYNYAVRFLKGQPERIYPDVDNSKMPVCVLNTLPRIAEQLSQPEKVKEDGGVSDIMHGRYITLIISVFTLLYVFKWAHDLYGERAGIFASFLFSICPNNLSNAGLVTTDAYSVLFLVATLYHAWKFCKNRSTANFFILSFCVALSQLVKQSLFHLYVLLPLCITVFCLVHRIRPSLKAGIVRVLVFVFINWLVINLGYYFHHSYNNIGAYKFSSHFFSSLQNVVPLWMPISLPYSFVQGLDQAKYYDQIGGGFDNLSSFGKVTILGRSATGGSFWYYYIVTIFFKTPIPFFIFFGWALWTTVKSWSQPAFSNILFLAIPVAYYLIIFSFFYKTQCGVRHVIFIYPLLFIFSSKIISFLNTKIKKGFFIVLNLYALVSVLSYWKNYYPYTNEFIPDKKMAYQYVGASNIEFLQGGNFLMEFLKRNSGVMQAPKRPANGTFVISTEDYLDIWNRHEYDWLKKYTPVSHVACTYLVFNITDLASDR